MSNQTITPTVRLGHKSREEGIRANIRTILLTSRGEVPFRPNFGLGAEQLLGGGGASIDIAYEVADQLARYEKRIRVRQVTSHEPLPGQRTITIRYEILPAGATETLTIKL